MGKNVNPLHSVDVAETVKVAIVRFFKSTGRDVPEINADTDLVKDTGASSDEGIDFAIDLSDALGVEVPHEFNPFVHESGERGMRFRELVERAKEFVSHAKESRHGG